MAIKEPTTELEKSIQAFRSLGRLGYEIINKFKSKTMNEKTDVFIKEVTIKIIEEHDPEEQGYILKSLLSNLQGHHEGRVQNNKCALDDAVNCSDIFYKALERDRPKGS